MEKDESTDIGEASYTNKYKRIMVSSPTCTAKSSHDKDEKISTNIGQDQHITSNLLRDNVFRPPYDYSSLEMDENSGMYSGQQRNFSLPLHWEKNVEFLRDRAKKLSPKFVSNWSSRRVAYFVSTLPGISYHHDMARNGCTNDQGKNITILQNKFRQKLKSRFLHPYNLYT